MAATWSGPRPTCSLLKITVQLFQIASLHGIGTQYGRKPLFERQLKTGKAWTEVSESFPEMENFIEFGHFKPKSDVTNINYGQGCCQYFQDGILEHIQTKTVVFLRQQLQSYKFFEPVKEEVGFMMTFHPNLEARIHTLARSRYSDDVSHKACVHIVYNPAAPQDTDTSLNFLTASLRFVLDAISANLTLSSPTGSPAPTVSLVVFGMDPADTGLIIADSTAYYRVYRPMPELTDAENLFLASRYCDSFLITATTDKLAWWMGYLQPSHVPVFYNAQAGGLVDEIDLADSDYFPVHWTSLIEEGDTVVVTKRFHLSRWQHKIFSKRRKHGKHGKS
uniref:Piwi domain-containing protein n=1 Tax=Panagrellus redivivus TaxID=6233 RepID=A0A7E4WAC8_PANRE